MTFLPIQFKTKVKSNKYKKQEVLDLIEEYLENEGFNYISRKADKIIFHKANGWHSWNFKSFLVSGVVKIKEENGEIEIINGNWLVILIALPFILILILGKSKYSTFQESDFNIFYFFFFGVFGLNLLTRIFAHLSFKNKIQKLLKN